MKAPLLALAFLVSPAFAGKSDIQKTEACSAGVMVVQAEPDLLVVGRPVNVFFAQAQARKLLKELRLKEPCDLKGRVRSRADGKCYMRSRLP